MLVDIEKLQQEYMDIVKKNAELVSSTEEERESLIKEAHDHVYLILSVINYYDVQLEKAIDKKIQEALSALKS